MKFGKRIIIINSLIIAFLTAIIVIATAVSAKTMLRNNIRNSLIDTVAKAAAIISDADGIIPDDFDYNVNGVFLSVYLSDGTLKNGSFPGETDLPINKGIVDSVTIENERYYVYDFAISLDGRNDIYLRGIVAASSQPLFIAVISVTVFAAVFALAAIILNILSVRKAVKPIEKMRKEVVEITESKDIKRRLSAVVSDNELNQLVNDYNYMLDSLEAMFRNHERFTSDVAHELRTPLTVILSESEYALRETREISDKNESLEVILKQSARLKAITDSLLEFTRFANKLKTALTPVEISSASKEFLDDYVFPEGTAFHKDIDDGITIAADITLYERILQNLLDNAVKYGKKDGNIFFRLKRESEKAILSVEDDGRGMNEETLKHAFDRFYREEKSRSDKSGFGLGLSLVKEIVRLFNGEIKLSSVLGKGTTVTIVFPIFQNQK